MPKKTKQQAAGDELYTRYETVDAILGTHIADGQLRDKRILCPCDPILPVMQQPTKVWEDGVFFRPGNKYIQEQAFVRWLLEHAVDLGIRSLTCSGMGDIRFGTRFGEAIDRNLPIVNGENLLDKCDMFRTSALPDYDVIITNPPFSKGSEFVEHLLKHGKDFILILPWNFYCSEAFYNNLDKVKLGAIINTPTTFEGKNILVTDKKINVMHKNSEQSIGITIFTTFDVVENESLHINQRKSYKGHKADYPLALNTKEPVIIVDRTDRIPYDYDGLMCVPLTFMDQYNPKEFEIVAFSSKYPKDAAKNAKLKKMHEQDMQQIKRQLSLHPDNSQYRRFLQHGYSDDVISWRGEQDIYYKHKSGMIKRLVGWIIRNRPGKERYIAPKASPKLKNANPLLGNKIYFYTSPLVPKCICIGQTTEDDVEKRIRQEFKNTPKAPYKLLHSEEAQKKSGAWFTDKAFHDFLHSKGYPHETGSHAKHTEWFRLDLKTALRLLQEFKNPQKA